LKNFDEKTCRLQQQMKLPLSKQQQLTRMETFAGFHTLKASLRYEELSCAAAAVSSLPQMHLASFMATLELQWKFIKWDRKFNYKHTELAALHHIIKE